MGYAHPARPAARAVKTTTLYVIDLTPFIQSRRFASRPETPIKVELKDVTVVDERTGKSMASPAAVLNPLMKAPRTERRGVDRRSPMCDDPVSQQALEGL